MARPVASSFVDPTVPVCVNVSGLSDIAVAKMEIRAFQALIKSSA
jgi:hypothetical protein